MLTLLCVHIVVSHEGMFVRCMPVFAHSLLGHCRLFQCLSNLRMCHHCSLSCWPWLDVCGPCGEVEVMVPSADTTELSKVPSFLSKVVHSIALHASLLPAVW